eukprot:1306877-Pyramimonas_sp.AAC.1
MQSAAAVRRGISTGSLSALLCEGANNTRGPFTVHPVVLTGRLLTDGSFVIRFWFWKANRPS